MLQQKRVMPKVFYHINTKNVSFIKCARQLQIMGVKNHKFHLVLFDPDLLNIDPWNIDPNDLLSQAKVLEECKKNFWYFIREVVRVMSPGGDPVPYELHRGNLTMNYCLTRNLSVYIELPRQNYKSISACAWYLWLYLFGTVNSQMLFATKDKTFAKENLERVKKLLDSLPHYFKYKIYSEVSGKELKEKSSVETMENYYNHNKIVTIASATSETKADQLGRGSTQPLQWYDEYAFINHNEIIYNSAAPAFSQASRSARANKSPYGMLMTSTPGSMKETKGAAAFKLIQQSPKWNNILFDMNSQEIEQYIEKNGETNFIYIRFMYNEIGRDEAWFKEQCRNLKYNWEAIKREVLLQWNSTSDECPFSYEELDMIESFVKQPIRQLKLSKYYSVDIYEEVNIAEPQIIGVDVSGGYRRDNSAFVAINSKTTKVQAVFKNPKIGPTELSKLLLEYVTTYSPNAVIVIERNSYGEGVIGNLRNSSIYNNLYYTINNNDPTREKTKDGWSMQTSSITKDYGIYTTKEVRERMHDLLRDRVIDHPDKFISPIILDEMKGLIWDAKHNRIDHSANTHDDTIMAYLMAMYMYYYSGTNILNFGIARRDIPRFGDEYGIESVEDITSQVIDPIMRVEQDEYMKTLFGTPRKTVMDYIRETEDQKAYELAIMDSGKNVDNGYILQTNAMKINNAINAAMLSPLDINPGMAQTMGGNFIVDMEPDNLANIFMGNMDTF